MDRASLSDLLHYGEICGVGLWLTNRGISLFQQ